MICPLFSSSHRWQECKKQECAWWDDGTPGCAELAKAQSLQKIEGLLFELIEKLPHEEER